MTAPFKRAQLTADLIEAFSGAFLSPMYDQPQPTPEFHREIWKLYCSDTQAAAVAAPRNHAKSTGLTHDYGLAVGLFREQDYIIILGATEEMAIEHLGDIASELRSNEDIIAEFGIKEFLTDQKTDIIVEFTDGHQLRYIARGAEQKIRGKKWRGKRPGLIIGDDIEDDEQVESKDRRDKFFRWLLRAAKQALRDGGKIRIHGTILHEDSALAKLMKEGTRPPHERSWETLCYRAHKSYDEFTELLWPEKFSEARLRKIRQEFINIGDAPGYSQEYLNDPFDHENAYLRRDDFVPMQEEDFQTDKHFCAAWDFAISQKQHADRTSVTVGGKDATNILCIVDQRKGRWDSPKIVDEIFSVQEAWNCDVQFVEKGAIWEAIKPMIEKEMRQRDVWINFVEIASTKDKAVRGRILQKRMRARGVKVDKQADWYPDYEAELLKFTGVTEALLDDQFDSSSLLAQGFERLSDVEVEDFKTNEEWEFEREDPRQFVGRSTTTGY